jgi:hypothetical protein
MLATQRNQGVEFISNPAVLGAPSRKPVEPRRIIDQDFRARGLVGNPIEHHIEHPYVVRFW